jgi:putative sugar O-methyltransferase
MRDDFELLDLMMRDEAQQAGVYKPGPYWRRYQQRAGAAIRRHGLSEFRSNQAISKGFGDGQLLRPEDTWIGGGLARAAMRAPVIRSIVVDHRQAIDAHARRAARYAGLYHSAAGLDVERLAGLDTLHAGGTPVSVNGRAYALHYLDTLARIESFGAAFDDARSVLEIGGGFGAFVHILLRLHPGVRKVAYLDIPPMLYVGTQYLRHAFGDAVQDYRRTRGRPLAFRPDDSLEILCICPWQVEALEARFDVCWNAASFGEMTPEIVANYARHITRLETRRLCLVLNKTGEGGTVSADAVLGAFPGYSFEPARRAVATIDESLCYAGQLAAAQRGCAGGAVAAAR